MAGGSSEEENHLSLNANNVFKIQTNVKVTFPETYSRLSIMMVQAVMRAFWQSPCLKLIVLQYFVPHVHFNNNEILTLLTLVSVYT